MAELWEHITDLSDRARQWAVERRSDPHASRNLLIQLPTGGGKSSIAANLLTGLLGKPSGAGWNGHKPRGLMTAHRTEIVDQNLLTIARMAKDAGHSPRRCVTRIAAGEYDRPSAALVSGSVATLASRFGKFLKNPTTVASPLAAPVSLVVVDEAHHAPARTWVNMIDGLKETNRRFGCPPPWVIGLTATPERSDGLGLGHVFCDMITGPSVEGLISAGILSDYEYYSRPRGISGEAAKQHRLGDPIVHFEHLHKGRKAIFYAKSVEESRALMKKLQGRGFNAYHVDGEMSKDERARAISAFRNGKIQVLTNFRVLTEGLDVPEVGVIVLLRQAGSVSDYLQMVGRGLRSKPDKSKATIIDHEGNLDKWGLPDRHRVWSLEGKAVQDDQQRSVPARESRTCDQCGKLHYNLRCPDCCSRDYVEPDTLNVALTARKSITSAMRDLWGKVPEGERTEVIINARRAWMRGDDQAFNRLRSKFGIPLDSVGLLDVFQEVSQ